MKGILFLLLLTILGFIAYAYTSKEGFQTSSQQGIVKIPKDSIPKATAIEASSPAPYMPPADKDYGPAFGELARVNTLPYRDPANETTTFKRLSELRQELSAFLGFEAKGLQGQGDPSIQLPLGTLRGDFQRVSDEADVLKRNPGLNSQLRVGDANDIQANLDYLRKKYRLSINSISFDASKEAFEDGTNDSDSDSVTGIDPQTSTSTAGNFDSNGVGVSTRASKQEIENARIRVLSEIQRLSASGTTDPITTGRVAVLTRISQKLDEILRELNSGARTPDQIPIMKKELEDFLPVAGDPGQPIPEFLNESGLPPILANLFPAYGAGDISGSKMAAFLFNQYADTVVKGLSWNIGMKYTSPNEAQAGRSSTTGQTTGEESQIPPLYSQMATSTFAGTSENLVGPTRGVSSPFTYSRGEMEQRTNPSSVSVSNASSYDWKAKSAAICEAIRRRGLNPGDFGCMSASAAVGPDYSWRGHARMICTRLQSSLDSSLPELCGCPPPDWSGWRA